MPDPNRERLIAAVELLRPVLGELVFVGGSVTHLLVTDEGAGAPRTTLDVDTITEITSYAAYAAFGERLRELGFSEDTREGAPVCRWVHGRAILDVMPLDEKVLGFSNKWYPAAMQTATTHQLSPGLEIRVITAPYFLATKVAAFRNRGIDEVRATEATVQEYLRTEMTALLRTSRFIDALPGHLRPDAASQARIQTVVNRMEAIAAR